MGGPFTKAARPSRPGAYTNFVVDAGERTLPGFGGVVHLPVVSDWGAVGQVVPVASIEQYKVAFGDGETAGLRAVRRAFQGEGVAGSRGATIVQAYRLAGTAKAKATVTLKNTAGTPVDALTLTAIFHGTRGNDFRVAVVNNTADSLQNDLVVYDGLVEIERYTHLDGSIQNLADQINAISAVLDATVLATAQPLAIVAAQPLAGGDSGTTLVAQDYVDWMTAVEGSRFSVVAAGDVTDSSIVASIKSWIQNRNLLGKRLMGVFGGPLGETVANGVIRTATLNDPNILSLGGQDWIEEGVKRSAAEMSPWLAGVVAARGDGASLTYARSANARPERTPLPNEVQAAIDGGLIIADTDTEPNAPTYLVKGVTSWTTKTDSARPYAIFKNPKFVRTMQLLEVEFSELIEHEYLGRFVVSDRLRGDLVTRFLGLCENALLRGAIQPGYTVEVDTDPPPEEADEFVQLRYGLVFGRSLEQVFNTIHVR